MRVMLREHVENLGKKGDIVNVAGGYARNYLFPKKMAVKVTAGNKKMIAIEQKALKKGFEKEMSTYKELISRLNEQVLSFTRKTGEKDVIFGSVSASDIKDALEQRGFPIEKKKILLEEPIKRLGNYEVSIKVFHEERAQVKIEVVKEEEPAEKETKEQTVHDEVKGEDAAGAEDEESRGDSVEAMAMESRIREEAQENAKPVAADENGDETEEEGREDTSGTSPGTDKDT